MWYSKTYGATTTVATTTTSRVTPPPVTVWAQTLPTTTVTATDFELPIFEYAPVPVYDSAAFQGRRYLNPNVYAATVTVSTTSTSSVTPPPVTVWAQSLPNTPDAAATVTPLAARQMLQNRGTHFPHRQSLSVSPLPTVRDFVFDHPVHTHSPIVTDIPILTIVTHTTAVEGCLAARAADDVVEGRLITRGPMMTPSPILDSREAAAPGPNPSDTKGFAWNHLRNPPNELVIDANGSPVPVPTAAPVAHGNANGLMYWPIRSNHHPLSFTMSHPHTTLSKLVAREPKHHHKSKGPLSKPTWIDAPAWTDKMAAPSHPASDGTIGCPDWKRDITMTGMVPYTTVSAQLSSATATTTNTFPAWLRDSMIDGYLSLIDHPDFYMPTDKPRPLAPRALQQALPQPTTMNAQLLAGHTGPQIATQGAQGLAGHTGPQVAAQNAQLLAGHTGPQVAAEGAQPLAGQQARLVADHGAHYNARPQAALYIALGSIGLVLCVLIAVGYALWIAFLCAASRRTPVERRVSRHRIVVNGLGGGHAYEGL
ncbi:hypothetical protein ANO11243_044740 [Dothideomycetidae sp. 11243]|nr:hypothetical protein ANO11243_044740 [fungal sp. No.11243]